MPRIPTGIAALHAHLSLTAERPVATEASRWLGEAEAIVADLDRNQPLERQVMTERLDHVQGLLAEVQDAGDPIAANHVKLARRLTGVVLRELRQNR